VIEVAQVELSRGLKLKRLAPSDADAWALFPILEQRLRAWIPRVDQRTDPEQVIWHIRRLWGTMPLLLGAWVAIWPNHDVIGHWVGWVQQPEIGEPTLLIYNAACDRGESVAALWGDFVADMVEWKEQVNAYAVSQHGERAKLIRYGRLISEHGAAFERILRRHAPVAEVAQIIEVDLG
jgi:hypothetical protein